MIKITKYDFLNREKGCKEEILFCDENMSGSSVTYKNFHNCSFENIIFDGTDFTGCDLSNALFKNCSFRNANFTNANMQGADLRNDDLTGATLNGANLFACILEGTILNDVEINDQTKWFRMRCPETGAFLGYKKCFNNRLVQLLIPEDAKRTSATMNSCRCSKAKVLTIKSFDYKEEFEEAWSLVDENFVYRKGEWVEVKDFNENRWVDSTTGIHFWMTREEALAY